MSPLLSASGLPLSVLDLAPIAEGSDAGHALGHALDLARHVEALGFRRFWLAEHHNMPGIASAATAVALAHVAAGTTTIRVGSGGIMLPNHAPLLIAEQFGTLAALHPGRIDLGLGRAPGTDQVTARAMRRDLNAAADSFPRDVVELLHFFGPGEPGQAVSAIPGRGLNVPIWILGSSLFGAQLAAALGLPFAFASHFAPDYLLQALEIEARRLFTSLEQAFIALRTGRPRQLPPPIDPEAEELQFARAALSSTFRYAVIGAPETVRQGLEDFVARTKVDEVIATANIFDHSARLRSFKLLSEVWPQVTAGQQRAA
jgi:alkanesulfonate monooxygenase SsuD/methylene tetrahydromethanopterin reductase-like flavin-dependent oxidoreductase (luciferase family)